MSTIWRYFYLFSWIVMIDFLNKIYPTKVIKEILRKNKRLHVGDECQT